ncbi:MAG TPA: carbohydrate kinase family protein [Candidatus Bathyarchaeia archaeon]|nr:carbohydrate kinase family protein [Candidatus Bathyarchaeia archaeon]
MKFDAVGFGALNVDKLYHVNKIARGGEESFILRISEAPGGSAANTIVGLARLGAKTGFIGKIASDHEGELLLHDFRSEGVNVEGVVIAEHGRSGTVEAFVDKKGERALYVHPSVNDTLEFKDVDLKYAEQTEFLHLTSMDNKPFQAQKKLVEELLNVKVSFDPGEIYAKKGLTKLRPIIKRSLVVMPSENELRMLAEKDFKNGAAALLKEGAKIVAVKLGEKGCYVTNGSESHLIPPFKTKVVDTTGAGDAFCAGFLYGLIKNKDLYACGRLGNFVASKCIAKVGARTGLPRASDLRCF